MTTAPATAALDLVWAQGTPFVYAFVLRDASGRRMDLTRYAAAMAVRATPASSLLALLTTENGHLAIDATAGEVTISLSDAEVTGISWTAAVYDLLLIDPAGVPARIYEGAVSVVAGVTRLATGVALPTV